MRAPKTDAAWFPWLLFGLVMGWRPMPPASRSSLTNSPESPSKKSWPKAVPSLPRCLLEVALLQLLPVELLPLLLPRRRRKRPRKRNPRRRKMTTWDSGSSTRIPNLLLFHIAFVKHK